MLEGGKGRRIAVGRSLDGTDSPTLLDEFVAWHVNRTFLFPNADGQSKVLNGRVIVGVRPPRTPIDPCGAMTHAARRAGVTRQHTERDVQTGRG